MVDDVPGGRLLVVLTNRQASVFNSEIIGKLLDVFDLNSPKLVLRYLVELRNRPSPLPFARMR